MGAVREREVKDNVQKDRGVRKMKVKERKAEFRAYNEVPMSWLIIQLIMMLRSFCETKLYYRLQNKG